MIKTIYLVHHTHTDLGYTHPQPNVRFLHQRFIDEVLEMVDATKDFPVEARLRWTCETTFPVLDWLDNASPKAIQRFQAAVADGYIDVTACWGVMDQSAPARAWKFILDKVEHLRSIYGLTIRSAMFSDINGAPWALPDLLTEYGIEHFSMAINEHFGKSALNRPKAFFWRGPQGGRIKLWNGLHYGSSRHFGIPYDLEVAQNGVQELSTWLEKNHYDQDFMMFQVTRPDFVDNGGPDHRLPEFVKEWNARGRCPRIEITTLTGFFDAIADRGFDGADEVSGEWTDFWNFGAGSTPFATSLNRRAYSMIADTESLTKRLTPAQAFHARTLSEGALEKAVTYDEHTWGSDNSILNPFREVSRSGLIFKLGYAHEAATLAKMARAEALWELAEQARPHAAGPCILIVNTLPWDRTEEIDVPIEWLRTDICPTLSHQHRMQYLPIELPNWGSKSRQFPVPDSFDQCEMVRVQVAVPANNGTLLSASDIFAKGRPQMSAETSGTYRIENSHFEVILDKVSGGIASLIDKASGREWIPRHSLAPVGIPLRETPVGGKRSDIYPSPDWTKFMGHQPWHTDWEALRTSLQPDGAPRQVQMGRRTSLRLSLLGSDINGGELEITLDETHSYVELTVRMDFKWDERPCAWYVPIEMALEDPVFDYENCDCIVRLGRDQVPGANMDYQTIHRWARIANDDHAMLVIARDTPIASLGGFFFGRLTDGSTPRRALLAAWLHNNYWDTNYAASFLGKFEATFYLKPSTPNRDNEANQFAEAVMRPLIVQPVRQTAPCMWEHCQLDSCREG